MNEIQLVYSENNTNNHKINIALLKPTFTAAAYNNAFYIFYKKHNMELYQGKNVTTDLNLLTSKIPNSTFNAVVYWFINKFHLQDHIKKLLPSANVSIITDTDVNNGNIFKNISTNGPVNKYNVIMLAHEEYVTQQEYDNLKKFVQNGGTLMLLSGNVFYAEVKYDPSSNSITLVKGHGVEFDSHRAHQGIAERWENETTQWIGSIFYRFSFDGYAIQFYNNPFNYSRVEEQTVVNPKDRIILNYNSSDTRYPIATYELDYGKGMVLVTGIASENVLDNKVFLKFFDDLLINCAIDHDKCTKVIHDVFHYKNQYHNNLNKVALTSHTGLQFVPWGGNSNNFVLHLLSNYTRNIIPISIVGNSGNKSVGFILDDLNHREKNISLTVGNVLKYGNFSHYFEEYRVSFDFKIKGLHNNYDLIFVHGRPILHEGWDNNHSKYYQNIKTNTNKSANLENILKSNNDIYSSINQISIIMEPNMVLNPMDFKILFKG